MLIPQMDILLSEKEVEWLLRDLCVKLGSCLPPAVQQRVINNPPTDVGRFTDVIYKAEGLDPELKNPLYQQVHEMVAKAFQQHKRK